MKDVWIEWETRAWPAWVTLLDGLSWLALACVVAWVFRRSWDAYVKDHFGKGE